MKTILKTTLVVIALAAFQSASAQEKAATPAPASAPAPAQAQAKAKHADMASWPELKTFHQVMQQTFHPSEEGNLKPIRERSGELNDKAIALEKSKIPSDFDTKEIVAATKELSAKTAQLNDLVKSKGTDEKVKASLSEAHDSFHKIIGLCNPGSDGHEGHGHDDQRK